MPAGLPLLETWRIVRPADAPALAVVAPTAIGLRRAFELGWTAWCEIVAAELAARGGRVAPDRIIALEPELIERSPAQWTDAASVEASCAIDGRRPRFLGRETDADGLCEFCHVPENLIWFAAHFPGHPVVPGVVLLDWAIERVRRVRTDSAAVREIARLKFQKPVLPGSVLRLNVSNPDGLRSRFRFDSMLGRHAGADLLWSDR